MKALFLIVSVLFSCWPKVFPSCVSREGFKAKFKEDFGDTNFYILTADKNLRIGKGSFGEVFKIPFRNKGLGLINYSAVKIQRMKNWHAHEVANAESEIAITKEIMDVQDKKKPKVEAIIRMFECYYYGFEEGSKVFHRHLIIANEMMAGDFKFNDKMRAVWVKKPPFERAKVYGEMGEKLQVLHTNDYVHSDIKPENVFYANDGFADIRFGDLGFAGKVGQFPKGGSSFYLSPERINAASPKLAKGDDIYALGMTIVVLELTDGVVLESGVSVDCFFVSFDSLCKNLYKTIEGHFVKEFNDIIGLMLNDPYKTDLGKIVTSLKALAANKSLKILKN